MDFIMNKMNLTEKNYPTSHRLTYAEALKICKTPQSFIKYVQDNKKEYWEIADFDKGEVALLYMAKEFFSPIWKMSKDFLDMVKGYCDEILELGTGGEVELYRGVRLEKEEDFNWNDVGNCWTYEYDSALEFLKYFTDTNKKPFLLSCTTDPDNIDWILSICLNLNTVNEKELRIYNVDKLDGVYIESVDPEDLD